MALRAIASGEDPALGTGSQQTPPTSRVRHPGAALFSAAWVIPNTPRGFVEHLEASIAAWMQFNLGFAATG